MSQWVHCYNCSASYAVPATGWDGTCPRCHEGFVEVLEQQPAGAPPPGQRGQHPAGGHYSSFVLPGGFGSVHVVYGGGGMGGGNPFAGGPFGGGGGLRPAGDPLAQLLQMLAGGPMGGADLFGGFGQEYDQEQMDRIITQIMNQYQPQSRETARRVRNALPRLRVRPRPPPGEAAAPPSGDDAEMGMASVCAGEPCSVCHDEFEAGKEVVELPCNHCFHEDCLMPWLEEHNTCPVCRLELPTENGGTAGGSSRRGEAARAPAAASSSRRQRAQQGEGPGASAASGGGQGGWMGSLNQLLHSIAERWEEAHAEGSHEEEGHSPHASASARASASAAAGPSVQRQPSAPPRQPSNWGGERAEGDGAASAPPPPDSPRTAAGRAAAARAAQGAAGLGQASGAAAPPPPSRGPSAAERTGAGAAGLGASSQQQQQQEEDEDGSGAIPLGVTIGGALGALLGGAISLYNRSRRSGNSERQ